jgi:hypothetical protein
MVDLVLPERLLSTAPLEAVEAKGKSRNEGCDERYFLYPVAAAKHSGSRKLRSPFERAAKSPRLTGRDATTASRHTNWR